MIPVGQNVATLVLIGTVDRDCAADISAKARLLLDYPHVQTLVLDFRAAGFVDTAGADAVAELHARAAERGKVVELRAVPTALAEMLRSRLNSSGAPPDAPVPRLPAQPLGRPPR